MTIRKLPAGGAWTPLPVNLKDNAASLDTAPVPSLILDDLVFAVAFTFIAPVSGILDSFEFYADFGAADPTTTLAVAFASLDSDDLPNSPAEFRVITVGDFGSSWISPGLITDDGTDTGVKRTVTRGEKLACVISFDGSNPGDLIKFGSIQILDDTFRRSLGGWMSFVSGSWDRSTTQGIICATLKYDASIQYPNMPELIPINGFGGGGGFHSGTTPDEIGLEFAFPTPVRIGGASMCLSTLVDGAAFDCVVYDQNSDVIETVPMVLHTDLFSASGYSYWTVRFSQDILVPGNEPYKITVKPSSTDTIKLLELSFSDSVILSDNYGYRDTGSNEHLWTHVERTDGGEWSYPILLPLISLNITGVDMDTGGATDDWEGDA
jgi:hypothetical protein